MHQRKHHYTSTPSKIPGHEPQLYVLQLVDHETRVEPRITQIINHTIGVIRVQSHASTLDQRTITVPVASGRPSNPLCAHRGRSIPTGAEAALSCAYALCRPACATISDIHPH
eukprot:1159834-Pelagomonas_calceolata.AAC.7